MLSHEASLGSLLNDCDRECDAFPERIIDPPCGIVLGSVAFLGTRRRLGSQGAKHQGRWCKLGRPRVPELHPILGWVSLHHQLDKPNWSRAAPRKTTKPRILRYHHTLHFSFQTDELETIYYLPLLDPRNRILSRTMTTTT